MDKEVETLIKTCIACQAVSQPNKPPPTVTSDAPIGPWIETSMDFYGPLPSGEKLLVVIDSFSRFPIVELMKSTTASNVISRLDKMFSIYGYTDRIRSDNGPPFKSHKIKEYIRQRGIHHERITPLWPRRNGIVESFMKNINKSIRTSLIDNRPWRQALSSMLFSYRNTTPATPVTNKHSCSLIATYVSGYPVYQRNRNTMTVFLLTSGTVMKVLFTSLAPTLI